MTSRTATSRLQSRAPIADAALRLAEAGWQVFPVKPRGKKPLNEHGFKDATTDSTTVRRCWNKWPDANIGLAIPEGFVIVDIDSPEALNELKARDFELPATLTVQTARGWHHYYQTDAEIRQTSKFLPGVDIRVGGKGYVIVPTSVHETGVEYELTAGDFANRDSIAPAPAWLEKGWLKPRAPAPATHEPFLEGTRNNSLASLAGSMRSRGSGRTAIEAALLADNKERCCPPLPEADVRRIAASISSYPVSGHRAIEPQSHRSIDLHDTQSDRAQLDVRLPLPEYTRQAAALTSGKRTSGWKSKTWEFTRRMRARPDLDEVDGYNRIPWGETDFSEEDRLAVRDEWDKVVFPAGVDPLELAAELATLGPLREGGESPLMDRFLSIAGHLQKLVGKGTPIKLPCRRVASLLGVERQTVSNLRSIAESDGFLEKVAEHDFAKRKATTFHFHLEGEDDAEK